jgi:uncharacterized protein (TIGR03118 family)
MFTVFGRTGSNSKRRPSPSRRYARPTLECLEDRRLLSGAYLQTNLVSNLPGVAPNTDPNLTNAWGIVASSTSPFWVADNGSGLSTLYNGSGTPQSLVVTIPPPGGSPPGTTAAPTGIVFNSTTDFVVSSGGKMGAAVFIFDTEDGTISGWSPSVNMNNAILEVDNSGTGAVYKGLALGSNNTNGNLLFATNFNAGTIDVYDKTFKKVSLPFKDSTIPAGFAPFGIRNIGGNLYVTYAMQNAAKHDDVAGPGNGYIDVFDTSGNLLRRLVSKGALNSPWGLALAPANFGTFSNDLIVGNFGDGLINAFDPTTGASLGQVQDSRGNAIHVDGLWGLSFGNGANAGPTNTLFFTAGINSERDGLFGSLSPTVTGTPNDRFVDQVYQNLLNRQADPMGLAFWSNQLNQGATRSQIVLGIESSTESLQVQVQQVYQQFLHRAADPAGLSFWVGALQSGQTLSQVRAGIAGSTEYFQSRGGGTNNGFLTALYQDALNRAIDSTGQAFYTAQLINGATTAQVAAQVFASTEFLQDLVKGYYQAFLHRAADTMGLNFYVGQLQSGTREAVVVAAIIGSDEFFAPL